MMLDPLASVTQLGVFLHDTLDPADAAPLLCLQIASGIIRDYLQMNISVVANDVVLLDPVGHMVMLPELPIASVDLVETWNGTAWATANPATYLVARRTGIIACLPNSGVTWPSAPETWRVTYTHGYAQIPDGIVGACLGVAANIYATEAGIDSETIGGYQVKYSSANNGFTALQLKSLSRRMFPRVA